MRNNTLKKLTAGCLVIAMGLLSACSGGNKANQDTGGEGEPGNGFDAVSSKGAMGRYVESELELPEECMFRSMTQTEDGKIKMVSLSGIMESDDGGENFKPVDYQPDAFGGINTGALSLLGSAIDKQGNIFLSYTDAENYKYVYVDHTGKETEINIDLPGIKEQKALEDSAGYYTKNGLADMKFLEDGTLLAKNYRGMLFQIEAESGKVLQQFGEEEGADSIYAFEATDGKVFVVKYSGFEIYNIEDGSLLEEEEGLKKYMESEADLSRHVDIAGGKSLLLERGEEEGVLYFCDINGLIRYQTGASEVEYLINGALNTISNPQKFYVDMVRKDDGSFLIGYTDDSLGYNLFQYEYSKDISAVPEKEIKVYTLEENENIRRAIANFQVANPEYYVNFEVGLTGDNAITKEDAINTLNTNIMAGKGPDILLLDGMPAQSYAEKGLLADLSDILKETDDKLYENVTEIYKNNDGVQILPTRFKIPVVMGEESDLRDITDINSLASKVESLKEKNKDDSSIIGDLHADELVDLLLNVYSDTLLKEDGTVKEEALKEFLEGCERIYKANGKGTKEKAENFFSQAAVSLRMMDAAGGKQQLNTGTIDGIIDLNSMVTINDNRGWNYKEATEKRFIPIDTIGINAKSGQIEDCKKFLKEILSVDVQKACQTGGLPVNQDAYEAGYKEVLEKAKDGEGDGLSYLAVEDDGEGPISMEVKTGGEKDFKQLENLMNEVQVAGVTNDIILNAIIEGGTEYLEGQSDLNACVNKVLQTVNLYLSE